MDMILYHARASPSIFITAELSCLNGFITIRNLTNAMRHQQSWYGLRSELDWQRMRNVPSFMRMRVGGRGYWS